MSHSHYQSSRAHQLPPLHQQEIPGATLHKDTYEIYNEVITNVIKNVKPLFYDADLDDEVIDVLRAGWIEKLNNSKVLATPEPYVKVLKAKKMAGEVVEEERERITSKVSAAMPLQSRPVQQMQQQAHQPPQQAASKNLVTRVAEQYSYHQNENNRPRFVVGQNTNHPQSSQQEPPNKQIKVHPNYHLDGHLDDSDSSSDDEPDPSSSSSSEDIQSEHETESATSESSGGKLDQEEKALCSDDDLSNDGDTLFNCENQVLCQYESVKRNKEKWTVKLLNGVMHIRNRDYVFNKLNSGGEIVFI